MSRQTRGRNHGRLDMAPKALFGSVSHRSPTVHEHQADTELARILRVLLAFSWFFSTACMVSRANIKTSISNARNKTVILRNPVYSSLPAHVARLRWSNRSAKSVPKECQTAKNDSRQRYRTSRLQWSEITTSCNALCKAGHGTSRQTLQAVSANALCSCVRSADVG